MSERLEKIADEILAVVNKKRVSGETPEKDVWVATYLPNREQIAVIFGDREVSGSYVQKRFNKDDKQSIISELEKLYGDEPKNHNEEELGEDTNPIQRNPHTGDSLTDYVKSTMWRPDEEINEDTVYDHSWYEVDDGDYPKRTKEGVMIKEEDLEETCSCGATGAGAVCETPSNIGSVKKSVSKVTKTACPTKRKHKKVSDEIDSILVKESILNDMPCESEINGHQFKYFMNEGKWYFSVDNCLVKTHDKDVMMETFDQIVDDEKVTASLLEDYSCYEMELLMEDGANVTAYPGDGSELSKSPGSDEEMNQEEIAAFAMAKKAEDAIKNDEDNDSNKIKTSEEIADEKDKEQKILNNNNQKVLFRDENDNLVSGVQQLAKKIEVDDKAGNKEEKVMATIKTSDGKEVMKSSNEIETPEKETL